jgi:hypothetical protein
MEVVSRNKYDPNNFLLIITQEKSEVLKAERITMLFGVVTPCRLVDKCGRFGEMYRNYLED